MASEEFVDIVNDNGDIVNAVTRSQAHQQGLLHKTVIAEVIDSQGRWLLVKQSASRQDAGQYVSPVGGHVTAGETELEALAREALEELGLQGGFTYEYVGRVIFNRHVLDRQENHFFILYKIFSDAQPVLNEESESCEYFTHDQLKNLLNKHPEQFGQAFHFVVNQFFSYLI